MSSINGVLLQNSGVVMRDSTTFIQDEDDATKQLKFQVSGITTGATRTLTIPDISDTVVTLTATQSLTNKSISLGGNLDVNGQSIVDSIGVVTIDEDTQITGTLDVDTINENTEGAGVTVDGVLLKDSGATLNDATTYFYYDSDNTKKLQFQLSELTSGATRTLTVPDISDTLVTLTATQTLTNKTITMGGELDMNGHSIVDDTGSVMVDTNLVVTGDLTVNGTTTTVNSTTVTVDDNLMVVNAGPSGSRDGGFLVERYQTANDAGTGDVVADTAALTFTLTDQSLATSTEVILPSTASSVDDNYNGWWVKVTSGSSEDQVRQIVDYVGATRTATLGTAWTTQNPAAEDTVALYNKPFIGSFYDESSDTWAIAATASDPGAAAVVIQDYVNLHVNDLTLEGSLTIGDSLNVDTINEKTEGAGVTVDGVLLKDSGITIGANTLNTNEWAYLDGLDQALKTTDNVEFNQLTVSTIQSSSYPTVFKDGAQYDDSEGIHWGGTTGMQIVGNNATKEISFSNNATTLAKFNATNLTLDTIGELTAEAGVTVDGVLLKDSGAYLRDSTTFLRHVSDATRKVKFQLENITTATTRTLTVPNESGTLTLNDATQTLTNKTITMGGQLDLNSHSLVDGTGKVTIDDSVDVTGTLAVDTIAEYTAAAGVTVDSVLLKDGGATLKDSTTHFQYANDATRQLQFQLSNISPATTRTLTIPNESGTITLNDATQTLTNKTITMGGDLDMNGESIVDGTGYVTINDNLVVTGDLTVSGTTTSVNSTSVLIEDNLMVVNAGPSGSRDGGFLVERYQTANDAGTGDVVSDTAAVSFTLPAQTAASSTEVILPATASSGDDFYNGWWIKVTSGSSVDQVRKIVDYVGASRTVTLETAWTTQNPASTESVSLYNKPFIGSFYDESADTWVLGATTSDPGAAAVVIQDYINLHVNDLDLEGSLSIADALNVDTINEYSTGAGVTVDGVLLKDSVVNVDTITSKTTNANLVLSGNGTGIVQINDNVDLSSGSAYLIDGTQVLSHNTLGSGVVNSSLTNVGILTSLDVSGTVKADTIAEYTSAAGVTVDGVLLKDGGIKLGGQLDTNGYSIVNLVEEGSVTVDDNLYVTGNVTTDGNITATSSIRYKENIVELSKEDVDNLTNLRPVIYNRIGQEEIEYGFIAEEVAALYPDLVHYTMIDGKRVPESLNYTRIIVPLVAQVKALRSELNQVLERLNNL
jgi:hypothetical protein